MKKVFPEIVRYSLFAVFPLFPFADYHVFLAGIPVYPSETLLYVACLAYVTAVFRKETEVRPVPAPASIGFLLIFSGFLVSSLVSGSGPSISELGVLKGWVVFPGIAAFLMFQTFVRPGDVEKAVLLWFLSAVAVSVVTLFPGSWAKETYDGRLFSFFRSPNHLAFFLFPAGMFGWRFFPKYPDVFRYGYVFLAEGLVISALIRTGSDGALVATLFGTGIFFVAVRFGYRVAIRMIVTVFVLAAVGFSSFLASDEWGRFSSGEVRNSLASRVMIWNVAADLVREHPFSGIGPRNFQESYIGARHSYPPYLEWSVPHPHNMMLSFWLSGGVLGLSGLFISTVFVLRSAGSASGTPGLPMDGTDAAILAAISGLLLIGLADDPYAGVGLSLAFWTLFAFPPLRAEMRKPGTTLPAS